MALMVSDGNALLAARLISTSVEALRLAILPIEYGTRVSIGDESDPRAYVRLAARLRREHEERWDGLIRGFRSLGIESVAVHTHELVGMLDAFLRWADLRLMWRGALA